MRNVHIDSAATAQTPTTQYRVPAPAAHKPAYATTSSGVGAQLTATIAIGIGFVALGCAVVSGDSFTLVAGNPLALTALDRGGIDALILYRAATLAFALALVVTGIRAAGLSTRARVRGRRIPVGLQAVISGLVAANLALIGWWTAWLFA
jgi:hypothetical protein